MHAFASRWYQGLAVCLCLGLGLATGCSDDDNAGDNNNTQQDAAVDAAIGESVSFRVEIWSTDDGTVVPAEGASVAFDLPGGERQEADTGADGRVTFDYVQWTLGDAAVTFYLPDYGVVSVVNMDSARFAAGVDGNGDYVMELAPLAPEYPEVVAVTGTATGLADVSHYYVVNTTNTRIQGNEWTGTGSQGFSITAPANEPFVLQALEMGYTPLPSGQGYDRPIYNVMHMDLGPLTASQLGMELDFGAYGMTTHTADVSVLMPPRADSPLRTGDTPYCFFCDPNSAYCHGWPTYIDVVDSHNRIDISFLWVEPAYAQDPFWFCRVSTTSGEFGRVNIQGAPQQDAQETMIDTPTWVTPADPLVAHDLHAPLEWVWYENVTATGINIGRNNQTVWQVYAGENATTATVPLAPSALDEAGLLGSDAYMSVYGGQIDSTRWWTRYAEGLAARVTP